MIYLLDILSVVSFIGLGYQITKTLISGVPPLNDKKTMLISAIFLFEQCAMFILSFDSGTFIHSKGTLSNLLYIAFMLIAILLIQLNLNKFKNKIYNNQKVGK